MNRLIKCFLVPCLILFMTSCTIVAKKADKHYNNVYAKSEDVMKPSLEVRNFHDSLPYITDMHADTLQLTVGCEEFPTERLLSRNKRGHVDVPRLLEGNVSLQVFSVYTKGSWDTFGEKQFPCGASGKDSCSRKSFCRDPDVALYDDADRPYADDYFFSREVMVYLGRLQNRPCKLWYQGGDWALDWTAGKCPDFIELKKQYPDYLTNRVHVERALWTADLAHRAEEIESSQLDIIHSTKELKEFEGNRRTQGTKKVAGLLSMEGLYFRSKIYDEKGKEPAIEKHQQDKQIDYLTKTFFEYYNAGYRMMSLTHFMDNDWGGSSSGVEKSGITEAGKKLVSLMLEHGIIIDVAHASRTLIADIVEIAQKAKQPVVYSHGGLSEYQSGNPACNGVRNISDEEIRFIASTGGVVGVGHAKEFNCGSKPVATINAMMHAIKVIDQEPRLYYINKDGKQKLVKGVEHVSLGSDYDGGITAHVSTEHLNKLTEALIQEQCSDGSGTSRRCFSDEQVGLLMGKNTWSLIKRVLPEKRITY